MSSCLTCMSNHIIHCLCQDADSLIISLSKNHTLTQSSFADPCTKLNDNALDSGFQFVAANATTIPQYSFTMTNVTGPLWFYCRQADHCQKGMVFAVNPTADKTFQAYQAKAMALGSVNPGNATTTTNSSAVVPSGVAVTGSATAASGSDAAASETAAANSAYRVGATSAMVFSSIGLVAGWLL